MSSHAGGSRRTLWLSAFLSLLIMLLIACHQGNQLTLNNNAPIKSSSNTSPAVATPASDSSIGVAKQQEIEIENYAFKPAQLTIVAGTKVTWINKDKIAHTATSDEKRFESGLISPGAAGFSYTFTAPGTYAYHCTPHPKMTGVIIVK